MLEEDYFLFGKLLRLLEGMDIFKEGLTRNNLVKIDYPSGEILAGRPRDSFILLTLAHLAAITHHRMAADAAGAALLIERGATMADESADEETALKKAYLQVLVSGIVPDLAGLISLKKFCTVIPQLAREIAVENRPYVPTEGPKFWATFHDVALEHVKLLTIIGERKTISCTYWGCSARREDGVSTNNVRYAVIRHGHRAHCQACRHAFICENCEEPCHADEKAGGMYEGWCSFCSQCPKCHEPMGDWVCDCEVFMLRERW
jgi:hypothetical protein